MTNLSAEALRELKLAAEKAEKIAPGPWRVETDEDSGAGAMLIASGLEQYVGNYLARLYGEVTADHIAAASPDVILALLAERERLLALIRRHVEWTEECAEDEELFVECLNQLNDMRAALAAAGEE